MFAYSGRRTRSEPVTFTPRIEGRLRWLEMGWKVSKSKPLSPESCFRANIFYFCTLSCESSNLSFTGVTVKEVFATAV